MAEIAMQFLYGSKVTASEIGEYLFYHRDSLTDWKGELFDYGDSCLWQDYLWERNGGGDLDAPLAGRVTQAYAKKMFVDTNAKFSDAGDKFIWDLIHDQATGMQSVANHVGGMAAVERLHRDWTLANLLAGKVSEPAWNYRNLELNGADSDYVTVDQGIAFYESNVNGHVPPTRKNVRRNTATEPWGAYYRTYGGSEPGFTMSFTGNAQDGIKPFTGSTEWYSGMGNMLQRTLERTFTGTVHLRFRYATDEAANGQGWYIDDLSLGSFVDPVDTVNGWVTDPANGWLFTTGQQDNDWTADAFVPFAKAGARGYQLVPVVGTAGQGITGKVYVPAQYQKSFKVYGIVSNRPNGTFASTGQLTLIK